MKKLITLVFSCIIAALVLFISCDENGDFLLFSIEDDKALGEQVKTEIANDPAQFPLLDRASFPEAYSILDAMLDDILKTGQVTYAQDFDWELFIINDQETLNAFATPGGKIYIYTGLIYFLSNLDDLMGVLGHEVAHSDRRHSSKQLQRQYTIATLLGIISGENQSQFSEILGNLATIGALAQYSQAAETEADDFSVRYLAETDYACNGAAAFFVKLEDRGQTGQNIPFLSTHPPSGDRIEGINALANELGCDTALLDDDMSLLLALQNALP
ncbi:MAG: M48 family metalloprotease [Bacteroidota bacterium]